MKQKALVLVFMLMLAVISACGTKEERADIGLADGVYSVAFNTDSSMFQANEADGRRGRLTVENGRASLHVSLGSKNILNLYLGLAADAPGDEDNWLQPTMDTVTYSDGLQEEVHGFDIPVPAMDREFDLALIGKKGVWYDHKVSVSDPVLTEKETPPPADGVYTCHVTLSGGSGRASVESPARITVQGGAVTAEVVWSSSHYVYMQIDGVQYDPVQTEGNSAFEIPVVLDTDMAVSALTEAMSQPHLVDYILRFDSTTLKEAR